MDIATLPGVTSASSATAFDVINNRYVIRTNLGITIISAIDGSILDAFSNPLNALGLHFGCENNLVGVYWNGNEEIFTSMDLSTGSFTDLNVLPGVLFLNPNTAFDKTTNRYAISTNLGVTIVDATDGSIIHNHPEDSTSRLLGLQFDCYNQLYGMYYKGQELMFASINIKTGAM